MCYITSLIKFTLCSIEYLVNCLFSCYNQHIFSIEINSNWIES